MVPAQLVAVALVFGIVVGGALTWLAIAAEARGRAAVDAVRSPLPDGVAAVVAVLALPAVVFDGSDTALASTEPLRALGLLNDGRLVHGELERLVDEARGAGGAREREFRLRRGRLSDAVLHVAARAAPVGAGAVLLVIDDRTDALRQEAVRRDFVANVSHELKTPIGAVGLLAEAVASAADEPEHVRRFAARLTDEADRLASITRDIIDFSRVQATDPLDAPKVVALDAVVRQAVEQNRVAAEARGIEIVVAKASGARVSGDAALLTTAVHNLISNAVQYSPADSRIGVGVRAVDDTAEVIVTDQGVGIRTEDLERIFERFYRADPARSRSTGGTGLGLSIVKHVAESHGGDVRVWSRLGNGSTFTIRLPAVPRAPRSSKRRDREYV